MPKVSPNCQVGTLSVVLIFTIVMLVREGRRSRSLNRLFGTQRQPAQDAHFSGDVEPDEEESSHFVQQKNPPENPVLQSTFLGRFREAVTTQPRSQNLHGKNPLREKLRQHFPYRPSIPTKAFPNVDMSECYADLPEGMTVELNGLFTDRMVVQRGVKWPVVGWVVDESGTPAASKWAGVCIGVFAMCTADGVAVKTLIKLDSGVTSWKAELAQVDADGPCEIVVTHSSFLISEYWNELESQWHRFKSEQQSIVLSDVLFGDVFLCAGQDHMDRSHSEVADDLRGDIDARHEARAAGEGLDMAFNKRLRLFQVEPNTNPDHPDDEWFDLRGTPEGMPRTELRRLSDEDAWVRGGWTIAKGSSLWFFSRYCSSVGDYLQSQSTDRPIGLIQASRVWAPITAFLPLAGDLLQCTTNMFLAEPFDRRYVAQRPLCVQASTRCSLAERVNYCKSIGKEEMICIEDKDTFEAPEPPVFVGWNRQIRPLIFFPLAAVIWWHGEADMGDVFAYRCKLPLLMSQWREAQEEAMSEPPVSKLPFVVVTAPGCGSPRCKDRARWMRQAQIDVCLSDSDCGVVAAHDAGRNGTNEAVLVQGALANRTVAVLSALVYQNLRGYTGPTVVRVQACELPQKSMLFIRLYLSEAVTLKRAFGSVQECTDLRSPRSLFQVSRNGWRWKPARLRAQGGELEIHSAINIDPACKESSATTNPKCALYLRHAFSDFVECGLVSENRLPLLPFEEKISLPVFECIT